MEKKTCETCRYYCEGRCTIPMWVDAELYGGREIDPDKNCCLYEEKADALSV